MNRRQALSFSLGSLAAASAVFLWFRERGETPGIQGVVWQVDNATRDIRGEWHKLGIRELLVQWSIVDDVAFIPGTGLPLAPRLPEWQQITQQPWAQSVIMGLAGRFKEQEARQQLEHLIALSKLVPTAKTPLSITGWYFPVEIDPTWQEAPRLAPLLLQLPTPLWVSVYDSANIGAKPLAEWLASWLPPHIGIFFQDGVGVYARTPSVARTYADALRDTFGHKRVKIIVEAFRPDENNHFRAAAVEELLPQIRALKGHNLYLFDGPHYLGPELTQKLARALSGM